MTAPEHLAALVERCDQLKAKIICDGASQFGPRTPDVVELVALYEQRVSSTEALLKRAGEVAAEIEAMADRTLMRGDAAFGLGQIATAARTLATSIAEKIGAKE